jgi:sugar phosphate isomerase/epimerase
MHPRICVNGISSWNWTLEQDLAFYRSTGINVVNIPVFKLSADFQTGVNALKRSGLNTISLADGGRPLIGGKALETLQPGIDAAAALGCPLLYFVSGGCPARMPTDEAYAALVEALAPVTSYARSKGVRLALEHNSTVTRGHGFIHTLAAAAELSRDADISICLELQNCWYERHLERLFNENVDRFAIVQVSDFLLGEEPRMNRRVMGDGSIPLEWMMERLLGAGYSGYFDIELVGPSIEAEGYASAIGRAVDWLSERLFAWGV